MNVEVILREAFLAEAQRRNVIISQAELENISKKFNIAAVQRTVDLDIERLRAQYLGMPATMAREIKIRERYHQSNLRKLAQDYAILLARQRIQYLTESKASEMRTMLKASAGKPCDAYPC